MKTIFLLTALLLSGVSHAFDADYGFIFKGFSKKAPSELRVLWWNILQGGKLAELIEKKEGRNPLLRNLDELTSPANKPEFLILGEYRPGEVKPEIDRLVKSRYKHAMYFPNSPIYPQQGILVLSDLDMVPFTKPVGWGEPAYREEWYKIHPNSKTYWDRSFIAIRYEWNGEERFLLPFHAIQPWMPLKSTFPARWAKILTALEILNGTTNPLYYQLEEYLSVMNDHVLPQNHKILMLGDLNTPDEILGIDTSCYRLLTSSLTDAFTGDTEYTFPAPSALKTPLSVGGDGIEQVRIDHALTSKSLTVKEAIRVPLRGSDHFPIAVTIAN